MQRNNGFAYEEHSTTLNDLPIELVLKILEWTNLPDVANFSQTNSRNNASASLVKIEAPNGKWFGTFGDFRDAMSKYNKQKKWADFFDRTTCSDENLSCCILVSILCMGAGGLYTGGPTCGVLSFFGGGSVMMTCIKYAITKKAEIRDSLQYEDMPTPNTLTMKKYN